MPDSPIYSAAFKYLDVVNNNPSWTFSKRLHMAQRLVEISEKLGGQQVGTTVRGSPFSALFAKDGPKLAMRVSRSKQHGSRSTSPALASAAQA